MQRNTTIKAQLIIFTHYLAPVGGIETFVYNLVSALCGAYNIVFMYDSGDEQQIERLRKKVRTVQIGKETQAECDILLMNSLFDKKPEQITAGKTIQIVHSCKMFPTYVIPKERDEYIAVSETAKASFKDELPESATVLHNIGNKEQPQKLLKLISATRLTEEKGGERIRQLADQLNRERIPFIWLIFTANEFRNPPKGVVVLPPDLSIKTYIKEASYLVQLSDQESYCYSIVEALSMGVPVITTPIDVISEIGVIDKVNGYVVPYDMQGIDVKEIYEHQPEFTYKNEDTQIIKKWRQIIGKSKGKSTYSPDSEYKSVEVLQDYLDNALNKMVVKGERYTMSFYRAEKLLSMGLVKEVET